MCCHMRSNHSCGHQHAWFARCFAAKRNNTHTCNMQNFPTWQHSERFPCPDCMTQRRTETQELLDTKGRKPSTAPKFSSQHVKLEYSEQSLPGQTPVQNFQPQLAGALTFATTGSIAGQLPTMANKALYQTQPSTFSSQMPWMPPSSRHAEIVGQLESSSPSLAHANEAASTHSSDVILSIEGSPRSSSGTAPAYLLQQLSPGLPTADGRLASLLES